MTSIVDEHRSFLYRLARRLLSDADEADDVVQTVLLRVWSNREFGPLERVNRRYLARAVVNAVRDQSRNKAREKSRRTAWTTQQCSAVLLDPFEELTKKRIREVYRSATSALTERRREVHKLIVEEGFSYGAVAARLGVSVRTIEEQSRRARRAIRRAWIAAGVRSAGE